jgi:GT2 family glycosyltransferase
MQDIKVIIPYFRAPELLKRCMNALSKQEGVTTTVHVRDNSEDNVLYTAAINEGLKKFAYSGDTNFILALNQDAYLRPDCLKQMVDVMLAHPDVGIVIPLAADKTGQIVTFSSLDAYPWGVSGGGSMTSVPKTPFNTYWANGACMLLRVEMIHEIGLLDQNMKFICSDSDYSFTARARGWNVMISPKAIVEHSLNASAGNGPLNIEIERVKLQDQLYFAKKWLNADLYRSLAYEGRRLTNEIIQAEIDKTSYQLQQLEGYKT